MILDYQLHCGRSCKFIQESFVAVEIFWYTEDKTLFKTHM